MSEIIEDSPLVLKYSPKTLDEVIGRDDFISTLNGYFKQGKARNMLLAGVQGTGKTLIANLAILKYYNYNIPYGTVLRIDASVTNKVEEIRDKVVTFLNAQGLNNGLKKTLFLDEADYLSKESQATLRKSIESAIERCWVIVACNYINKIILPIQSRLEPFYFEQLPQSALEVSVDRICKGEGIKIEGDRKKIMDLLYKNSRGEIRFMINAIMEEASMKKVLNEDLIKRKFPSNNSFIKAAIGKNLESAISIGELNPKGCLTGAIDFILDNGLPNASMDAKVKLIRLITEAMRNISNNIPPHFEIPNLVYQIVNMISPPKPVAK